VRQQNASAVAGETWEGDPQVMACGVRMERLDLNDKATGRMLGEQPGI
jgi:hypothetical protein